MTLLDKFMKRYDFNEFHSIWVRAKGNEILNVVKEIRPSDVPLFKTLFHLPLLPKRFVVKTGGLLTSTRPIFDQAIRSGFVLLAENPDEELVMGSIGQFWRLGGGSRPVIRNAEDFVAFEAPGYAKASINFRVEGCDERNTLSTETRVLATDPASRRNFFAYWRMIHPGSALLRRMWLIAIKQSAERLSHD